jgi:hypothetical protein
MSARTPIDVAEITSSTTYQGPHRLYWINIHATANSTVTISNTASTELMSIYAAANTSKFIEFRPSLVCSTHLVIALTGTAKITTARAPG